ncbi:MAG: hypothetical protein ACK5P0_02605 [bacterium]|jgi:hypothetical protein
MNIDDLILSGAVEPVAIDSETGEMLYTFTDKLKDVSPALHREVNNMFDSHIMRLWELDMIDMDVTDSNPIVRLTKKAFHPAFISKLNEDELHTLKEIKRSLIRE